MNEAPTELTQEQKRIKIAKACGWKQPFGPTGDWERPDGSMTLTCRIPNYFNDLNAMHEAEKTLTDEQCRSYNEHIMDARPSLNELHHRSLRWSWGATASQRAEAFGKTLNLW